MDLSDFKLGARVEISPATDLWMRGARFGEVVKLGRRSDRYGGLVSVKLDRTGHTVRFAPSLIHRIL